MLFVSGDRYSSKSVWVYGDDNSLQWTYDTGGDTLGIITDIANNVYVFGSDADNGDGNGTRNIWKLNSLGQYITGARVNVGAGWAKRGALDSSYLYVATGYKAVRLTTSLTNETLIRSCYNSCNGVAVDGSGNIYVLDKTLHKYNSNLVKQWDLYIDAPVEEGWSIALTSNGNILFSTSSYTGLYCYTPDKELVWYASEVDGIVNWIVVANDGAIYTIGGSKIYKVNSSGEVLWYVDTPDYLNHGCLGDDDYIYVAAYRTGSTYTIYKFDPGNKTFTAIADTGDQSSGIIGSGVAPASQVLDKRYSKKLIAVANSQLWYEDTDNAMTVLSDSATPGELDTSVPLNMVEAFQKIFTANNDNLKVADFGNIKITTDNVGANPPDRGNVLLGGISGAKMAVDYITSLSGACTIYGTRTTVATFQNGETVTGTDDDGNAISFSLSANEVGPPHWYDWTVYGNDATYGAIPEQASLVTLYRGRLVLAGDNHYPHQWYMSRQGNPWDWQYVANDAQAPVAGGNADAGEIGDIITSLIPYKDDYLIFGCSNTIWFLSGDPASGGSLNELDLTTGIFGAQSWCFDGGGNFYFWGNNGLYKTTIPGQPQCISQQALPKLVKDEAADPETHRIVMGFDDRRNGILTCIVKTSDGTNSNYFYNLITEGFFPEVYPNGIFSIFKYNADNPSYQNLLLGSWDGYIRYFNDSKKDDDDGDSDTAIDSYVGFGPLQIVENSKFEGKLIGLIPVTGGGASGGSESDSDNVTCKVFLGKSAEEIIEKLTANSSPNFSRTVIAPGRSKTNILRQKLRGVYAGILLENNAISETWSLEKLIVDSKNAGRLK